MLWYTGEDKMIDGLILAIQFLTRLPIKKPVEFDDKNLSRSILFFPLAGLIIGSIGGLFYHIFSHLNEYIGTFCLSIYDSNNRRPSSRWIIGYL